MRICSTEYLFIQRYKELCIETLVPRGYDRKLISSQLAKLKFNIPGEKYIEKRKFALLKVILIVLSLYIKKEVKHTITPHLSISQHGVLQSLRGELK